MYDGGAPVAKLSRLAAPLAVHKIGAMHWLGRHRLLILAMICALWSGFVLLSMTFPEVPFLSAVPRGEQNFGDLLRREGRKAPTRSDFVFLGIDESTLQFVPFDPEDLEGNRAFELMTERAYPWSRELWAVTLDRLFEAGARLVMFDLMFGKPGDGDAEFRAALERYRDRVVIGANFDFSGQIITAVWPHTGLIPEPQDDDRVGYVVFFPTSLDGKIRSVRYLISERQLAGYPPHESQEVFHSFAARAVAKLGQAGSLPTDLEAQLFRFGANDSYQAKPLWEIFDPAVWRANYGSGEFFKDKIVMIGAASQVEHDFVATPVDMTMPGPVLHLHALAAALAGEFLHLTPIALRYLLVCCGGLAAWLLVAVLRRPLVSLIALVTVTLSYLVIARVAYDQWGLLLLTVPVLIAFVGAGASALGFDHVLERMEKIRTRRTLERYVSKNLVKEILENPGSFYSSLRGVRLPVTVLFSDLVGFTSMTESADPEKLVKQLNEYLSRMTAAVFENDGTLDKFIGDAVMAVWGNVSSRGVAEDARAAARTALAMRGELQRLNENWAKEGIAPFKFGLGINHGEVLAANIGSQEKADPTVIGDAVNLASRLEALTRTYGVDVLIGQSAAELIRDDFHLRSVARVQVKGKTKPVEIFTLLGARDAGVDPELLRWLETYEEALRKFRARNFSEAKIQLSQFLEFYPEDALAKMYLERSLEYEQEPPDESWTAAEVFTKK
jgi:adenylate cyclase